MHGERSKLSILTAAFAAAGIAAGIVRALQLLRGFEPVSGLSVKGSPYGTVLTVASVLVLAAGGVLLLLSRKTAPALKLGSLGGAALVLLALSSFFGCFGGALYAASNLSPMNMLGVVMGIALLISGLTLLHSARIAANGAEPNAVMLLPVLWGCLELILTYRDLSRSAAVSNYAYTVYGVIALILIFFAIAACAYRPCSTLKLAITSLLGLFFTGLCGFGSLIQWLSEYGFRAFASATAIKYFVIPSFTMLYGFFAALGMLTLLMRPKRPSVDDLIDEGTDE